MEWRQKKKEEEKKKMEWRQKKKDKKKKMEEWRKKEEEYWPVERFGARWVEVGKNTTQWKIRSQGAFYQQWQWKGEEYKAGRSFKC